MDWRYEIKYTIAPDEPIDINSLLLHHPASFYKIFPDRIIHNVYLDTPDFESCLDNLSGISNRIKTRIRWYGKESPLNQAVVEQKIKSNMLGTKRIYSIGDCIDLNAAMRKIKLKLPQCNALVPSLKNAYTRSYYISLDHSFRLTIDRNIQYQIPTSFGHAPDAVIKDPRIIVEIKFKAELIDRFKRIERYFPLRRTKHSKYVSGVLACYAYR